MQKENSGFGGLVKLFLIIGAGLLVGVMFVPMWRIDLDAPQYPEGLRLLIYTNKLAGNVDIINGLNHYIGMKTLHTEDFIEFSILNYIIGFFAAFFLVTAIAGKKKLLNVLLICYVLFGTIAMIDFWKWEYNYGHNLNPDAAIIVPGMAYQPPLIGFKQLLNFGAYSVPDIGGWFFIASGLLLVLSLVLVYRAGKIKKNASLKVAVVSCFILFSMNSCTTKPEALKLGVDNCSYCSMTISNNRFGAEVITKKGKIYKYDEIGCLLSHIKEGGIKKADIKEIYSADFCGQNSLINVQSSFFLKSDALRSPMGSNIAAFGSNDSLKSYQSTLAGEEIKWNSLYE